MQAIQIETTWKAPTLASWYRRHGSRCLDWMFLILLLPPAIPLMLAIATVNAFVFRSLRCVLFLQPRIGWRGRPFQIYKFRTMTAAPTSEMGSWANGTDHLRVTCFGRLLRNTHLDELPQLFNILIGEMSFIGPRPEMVEIEAWAAREIPGFSERLMIRPGLAGLAQITQGYTGRDVQAYAEKLEINRYYIDHTCLLLDLKIACKTAHWMIMGKGWQWNKTIVRPVELASAAIKTELPKPQLEHRHAG